MSFSRLYRSNSIHREREDPHLNPGNNEEKSTAEMKKSTSERGGSMNCEWEEDEETVERRRPTTATARSEAREDEEALCAVARRAAAARIAQRYGGPARRSAVMAGLAVGGERGHRRRWWSGDRCWSPDGCSDVLPPFLLCFCLSPLSLTLISLVFGSLGVSVCVFVKFG
ncbi:hypothetical protein SESBI_25049 [Sesbania bispinosa]|nr:hypothetical protein SESBI_25049 [Sesbania bispinosa]